MDGPGTERRWFSKHVDGGVPLSEIQEEYGSLLYASDAALDDTAELLRFEGIDEEVVESFAELSPMDPPGEWNAIRRDDGGYEFSTESAQVRIEKREGGYVTRVRTGSGRSLTKVRGIDDVEEPLISEFWTAKRILEHNPQGVDSKVPSNVETPDQWELWQNLYRQENGLTPVAWRNEDTRESLRIRGNGDVYELAHQLPVTEDVADSVVDRSPRTLEGFQDLLEKVEMQMRIRSKGKQREKAPTRRV